MAAGQGCAVLPGGGGVRALLLRTAVCYRMADRGNACTGRPGAWGCGTKGRHPGMAVAQRLRVWGNYAQTAKAGDGADGGTHIGGAKNGVEEGTQGETEDNKHHGHPRVGEDAGNTWGGSDAE